MRVKDREGRPVQRWVIDYLCDKWDLVPLRLCEILWRLHPTIVHLGEEKEEHLFSDSCPPLLKNCSWDINPFTLAGYACMPATDTSTGLSSQGVRKIPRQTVKMCGLAGAVFVPMWNWLLQEPEQKVSQEDVRHGIGTRYHGQLYFRENNLMFLI